MNTTIKAIALAAVIALVAVTLVSEDSSAVEFTDGGFEYSASGNSATVIGWEGDSSEITIPATVTDGSKTYNVTKIGTEAFMGSGITAVDFSKATNLTTIEGRAFYGLAIAEITLPSTLTSLGDDAFSCNDAVKTVEIPAKLSSYNNSFANCSSLESITVASGNTHFKVSSGMLLNHDGDTILQCPAGMTVKNLPADITKIGKKAFQGSTIDKFTITENMTSIGEGAFADCESLTAFNMDSNSKNKTFSDYRQGSLWGNNIVFCALAGLLWYSQFFGLSLGKGFLTDFPVLITFSWCILMALNVTFSNVWGIILKEWKGCSRQTIVVLLLGLLVLIVSSFLPQLLK